MVATSPNQEPRTTKTQKMTSPLGHNCIYVRTVAYVARANTTATSGKSSNQTGVDKTHAAVAVAIESSTKTYKRMEAKRTIINTATTHTHTEVPIYTVKRSNTSVDVYGYSARYLIPTSVRQLRHCSSSNMQQQSSVREYDPDPVTHTVS